MPGFAGVADQLLARHHARDRRRASGPGAAGGGLGWAQARGLLERAAGRYGRDNSAAAVIDLGARSELLVRFVERVRWSSLCEQPMRYSEPRYARIWAELQHDAPSHGKEAAA